MSVLLFAGELMLCIKHFLVLWLICGILSGLAVEIRFLWDSKHGVYQGLKLTVARSPKATNFAPGPLKVYIWSPTWRLIPQEYHTATLLTKLSQVLSIYVWEFKYPIPWSNMFLYQFYKCSEHLNPLVNCKHVKGGVGWWQNFMVN